MDKRAARSGLTFGACFVAILGGFALCRASDELNAAAQPGLKSTVTVSKDTASKDPASKDTAPQVALERKTHTRIIPPDSVRSNPNDIETVVLTPDGRPADGAKARSGFAGTNFTIFNGEFDGVPLDSLLWTSDRAGRFFIPVEQADAYLAILHPSGYALCKPSPKSKLRRIVLDPWTHVEGRYVPGGTPRADSQLAIMHWENGAPFGNDGPHVEWQCEATSQRDGRYLFERVPAGKAWIGGLEGFINPANQPMPASSYIVRMVFPVGKTLHTDIGTTGRSVTGTLRLPAKLQEQALWSSKPIWLFPKGSRDAYFRADVNDKGTFRIDNVPSGEYSLEFGFNAASETHSWQRSIWVPRPDGSGKPLDLGVLTLKEK